MKQAVLFIQSMFPFETISTDQAAYSTSGSALDSPAHQDLHSCCAIYYTRQTTSDSWVRCYLSHTGVIMSPTGVIMSLAAISCLDNHQLAEFRTSCSTPRELGSCSPSDQLCLKRDQLCLKRDAQISECQIKSMAILSDRTHNRAGAATGSCHRCRGSRLLICCFLAAPLPLRNALKLPANMLCFLTWAVCLCSQRVHFRLPVLRIQ